LLGRQVQLAGHAVDHFVAKLGVVFGTHVHAMAFVAMAASA
jgi:hypothetical protein